MLEFCVLASGSRANCIYVGSAGTRVLVDCGLSGREAARRLSLIDVAADSIDAIVITHEHEDHVSGARVFSKRHDTKVYANRGTVDSSKSLVSIPQERFSEFQTGTMFCIGSLTFEPFSLVHDAEDPVGFRIQANGSSLAVLTDLGQVTTLVRERLRDVDALVLESNHDPKMLEDAPYPWELKQRIGSRRGHLSNQAAGSLIEEVSRQNSDRLKVAVAAHISEKSNMPELAVQGFRTAWHRTGEADEPEFAAALPDQPTKVFKL